MDGLTVTNSITHLTLKAHAEGTAHEIIDFFESSNTFLQAVVTGTGTGGTLMGCKETLDRKYPMIRMIAVEPEESPVMSEVNQVFMEFKELETVLNSLSI